jgi:hypothetical protein
MHVEYVSKRQHCKERVKDGRPFDGSLVLARGA